MILVDKALEKRVAEGKPLRVAMFGAGYSARHIAAQILSSFPGIHLTVIVNRTVENAKHVFKNAGVNEIETISAAKDLEDSITKNGFAVTDDPSVVFGCEQIEAVIETTGEVEYGAQIAMGSIAAAKHTIVLNCEMDATVGPLLKKLADEQGVVYSNTDGDEPGVASNLSRFVSTIGLEVVGGRKLEGILRGPPQP